MKKLECIKGLAYDESVVCMEGDVVTLLDIMEGEIVVEGLAGWCMGMELCFSPKELAAHFKMKFD